VNLIELTERYVDNFNKKNMSSLELMIHEEATLVDPENTFSGKEKIVEELNRLLSHEEIMLDAVEIYNDAQQETTLLEFKIRIDDLMLKGIDAIKWKDNKIYKLTAYVNEDNYQE